jgi:predicted ATP-dependent endonuclease of OLD family
VRIKFIEIANFRKLRSVHIDLADAKTLFVGANNSGKTSAMVAMRQFLGEDRDFNLNDFTLSHWGAINKLGLSWLAGSKTEGSSLPTLSDWTDFLPFMDVWLEIADDEIHYVSGLLPTLEWKGGLIGVRLRYEPENIEALYRDFIESMDDVDKTKTAAKAEFDTELELAKAAGATDLPDAGEYDVTLWPNNMIEFLERRQDHHFGIVGYALDPKKIAPPNKGIATPQAIAAESLPLEGDPFAGLIRVNEINAQRGFGISSRRPSAESDIDGEGGGRRETRKLSDQLRDYYAKHLDPFKKPEPADLRALHAIEKAQAAFDRRLTDSFARPIQQVEGLGYPGVTDPRLKISTRIRPADGLNHSSAVQYEVAGNAADGDKTILRLPEDYNGLGYQNLISMVFRLMSFRDGWLRIGKASTGTGSAGTPIAIQPLHLVLIEEPEAHLHAQVQQVFIKKAFAILRDHPELGAGTKLTTQMVVSSHSSHVAHEVEFSSLRYFRRLPAGFAGSSGDSVPTSTVVNMSEVFGPQSETARFVKRYLKSTHCDLFFADAAVLVEGPAERVLVPQFVRQHFPQLDQCYITWLEIGGSHAHRLRPLIEHLGLLTLVITDLDACDPADSNSSRQPKRKAKQDTNNQTLKSWLPITTSIDALLDKKSEDKIQMHDALFSVRVAYQCPVKIKLDGTNEVEALANTLEDALVFENLELFRTLDGTGLIAKFRKAVVDSSDAATLGQTMFDALKKGKKAEFALDLLDLETPKELKPPAYISEGLTWLQDQLRNKQAEVMPSSSPGDTAAGIVEVAVASPGAAS